MGPIALVTRSSVGRKVIMAVSGALLFGFVVVHMLGNLQIYQGPDAINRYGELIHANAALLWAVRLFLLLATAVHIWAATALTLTNLRSRPKGYRVRGHIASTYASRTMVWSGPIIAAFVVYHLLHLSLGSAHPDHEPGNVYHNVVAGFQVWYAALIYIAANVALGFHLFHGVWSALQSIGASHPAVDPWRSRAAAAVAFLVAGGNISIPLAVLTGIVS